MEYNIKAGGSALMALVDRMYQNKLLIPIQEILSNALDIHEETKTKRKIDIHMPSINKPEIKIRDYGTGLSESFMDNNHYGKLGFSKNKNRESARGMFGLGSKAPLCYAEQYTVDSFIDGVQTTYLVFLDPKDEDNPIKLSKMPSLSTNEPNGLSVSWAINPNDITQAIHYLHRFYSLNSEKIALLRDNCEISKEYIDTHQLNWYKKDPTENYFFVNKKDIPQWATDDSKQVYFNLGGVLYSCPEEYTLLYEQEIDFYNLNKIKSIVIIDILPKKILCNSSRSHIRICDENKEEILKILKHTIPLIFKKYYNLLKNNEKNGLNEENVSILIEIQKHFSRPSIITKDIVFEDIYEENLFQIKISHSDDGAVYLNFSLTDQQLTFKFYKFNGDGKKNILKRKTILHEEHRIKLTRDTKQILILDNQPEKTDTEIINQYIKTENNENYVYLFKKLDNDNINHIIHSYFISKNNVLINTVYSAQYKKNKIKKTSKNDASVDRKPKNNKKVELAFYGYVLGVDTTSPKQSWKEPEKTISTKFTKINTFDKSSLLIYFESEENVKNKGLIDKNYENYWSPSSYSNRMQKELMSFLYENGTLDYKYKKYNNNNNNNNNKIQVILINKKTIEYLKQSEYNIISFDDFCNNIITYEEMIIDNYHDSVVKTELLKNSHIYELIKDPNYLYSISSQISSIELRRLQNLLKTMALTNYEFTNKSLNDLNNLKKTYELISSQNAEKSDIHIIKTNYEFLPSEYRKMAIEKSIEKRQEILNDYLDKRRINLVTSKDIHELYKKIENSYDLLFLIDPNNLKTSLKFLKMFDTFS